MNLWRRIRTEASGAWRSLRYDLGRPPAPPAEHPEITCTGMSTFGAPAGRIPLGYGEPARPPRRLAAVSAFVLLAAVGAAASYLAVVAGLGSLLREKPAAPRAYPLAAAAPQATGTPAAPRARLGQAGPTPAPTTETAVPAATTPAGPHTTFPTRPPRPGGAGYPPAEAHGATPGRSAPPCSCPAPPVPTPTAPSPSPSASTDPSPSASPSDGAGGTGGSAAPPVPSTGPTTESLQRRQHRQTP